MSIFNLWGADRHLREVFFRNIGVTWFQVSSLHYQNWNWMFVSLVVSKELSTDLVTNTWLVVLSVKRKRRRYFFIDVDHETMRMNSWSDVLSWEKPNSITINLIWIWKTLYLFLGSSIFWVFYFLNSVANLSLDFIENSKGSIGSEVLIKCQNDIPM